MMAVFKAKMDRVSNIINGKEQQAREAETAGHHERARSLREEIAKMRANYDHLNRTLPSIIASQLSGSAPSGSNTKSESQATTPKAPVAALTSPAHPAAPLNPSQPQSAPEQQPPITLAGASPQMAAQMKKLIDSSRNRTPRIPSATVPSAEPSSSTVTAPPGRQVVWRGAISWKGSDSATHEQRNMQAFIQTQWKSNQLPDGT
jgi:hypothetical protein